MDPRDAEIKRLQAEIERQKAKLSAKEKKEICRFGLTCNRRDCTRVHITGKSKTAQIKSCINQHKKRNKICRFGDLCTNTSCKFRHTKQIWCQHGGDCLNVFIGCPFKHKFNEIKCPDKSDCTRDDCPLSGH